MPATIPIFILWLPAALLLMGKMALPCNGWKEPFSVDGNVFFPNAVRGKVWNVPTSSTSAKRLNSKPSSENTFPTKPKTKTS
ncbi:MAG: hypothetical protein IPM82_28135 [Saprospiraceae bacterium]|nr:hypothetical protein [Saprospiraceae bacterium]